MNEQFLKFLDEEERKYMDPHVGTTIKPRVEVGLVRQINEKLEGIMQDDTEKRKETSVTLNVKVNPKMKRHLKNRTLDESAFQSKLSMAVTSKRHESLQKSNGSVSPFREREAQTKKNGYLSVEHSP
jgi:hypothetical protein